MTEQNKISLVGFDLDPAEKAIVDNTVKNYVRKLDEKITYQELKLSLRQTQHGKTFSHEVQGELFDGKSRLSAKAIDYNLYSALSEVFEKLLNEADHKKRTSRQ